MEKNINWIFTEKLENEFPILIVAALIKERELKIIIIKSSLV